ncbi:MAG: transcriptional regulatory [Lasallia pustulata]|uniref:Transcriptional regulatory n=1 Tax=Lasallia pustulata TaxID=136370 RepID=A0A5M8PJQ1_9LECA|nr:MAG: transcriptional regulatory [Lasallia pustulata]
MSSLTSSDKASPPQSRQKPGSACEECRRRKLRCDRQQPRCRFCSESSVVCTFTSSRPPRGPKKGHLKVLQARIAALEGRLNQQQNDERFVDLADETVANGIEIEDETHIPVSIHSDDAETPPQDPLPGMKTVDASVSLPETCISDIMQADLDQLYFDRVHSFAPFLHQRRYYSWNRQPAKTEFRTCLQFAMWTLAASVSAQFQNIGDPLYRDTRQKLEALELKDTSIESIDIEQVQAWILLAIYEFMRTDYRRGWMSAGRAFRLIQLMRLHEIDAPNCIPMQIDWIEIEERRRTFWMAYSLDRFISIRNEWPLTLSDSVIMIRLPAPEVEFQSGQPILMGFLSEAITANDQSAMSPFTECTILATISGRALSHRHQSLVENIYVDASQDFWERHQWINATLTDRMQIMSHKYPPALQHVDSMLLFTSMMAQAAVLYLYKIMMRVTPATEENQAVMMEYQTRSLIAAQEIANLSKILPQLSRFKVHPFTPIPLSLCAEFFTSYRDLDDSVYVQLHDILEALRSLRRFNNLAQCILHLFELESVEGL